MSIEVYESPSGWWCAQAIGVLSDGFKTREDALVWALAKASGELERLWEAEDTLGTLVAEADELIGNLIDCTHGDDPCPESSLYCDFTRRALAAGACRCQLRRQASREAASE